MAVMAVESLVAALGGERPAHLLNVDAWPEKVVSVGEP
jgi:hypothetical protein